MKLVILIYPEYELLTHIVACLWSTLFVYATFLRQCDCYGRVYRVAESGLLVENRLI